MIVEKQPTAMTSHTSGHSVRFLVYGTKSSQKDKSYQIDLAVHNMDSSKLTLSDENGRLLLEEQEIPQHTYVIRNLTAGTYFFEVSDGFFYQIKELRITA